ncbi:hypothetical protein [Pseudomonas viridiflava]|uniref:hypothetical protein n=1 Tax=Pseudomonas viridiflava TaxID=33069 RepID=UPI000F0353A7|nr:hypothetical protein [Pseudomonas viridiflava]
MTILDFREIAPPTKPTKKAYGGHLDDFEKFAQEFFLELFDARFIEVAARGADGGRDLLFEILIEGKKQKWAVSCKHTAHTGNAVGEEERNISDRFAASGADVFVCFYSHIATSSLQRTLIDIERYNERFKFRIFNSARIESTLLSADNGKGWFLAARYFQKSFVKLFHRFLQPINHYKVQDVDDDLNGRLELPYPGGAITYYSSEEEKQIRTNELLEHANDSITLALNEAFFAQLLTEITEQWPTCFAYWEACPTTELRTSDILPTFNVQSIVDLFDNEASGIALIVCFFWTWWDEERAIDVYQKAFTQALGTQISEADARTNLSTRMALFHSPIALRDKITRFIAFANLDLSELRMWDKVSRTAQLNGKEIELQNLLIDIYKRAIKNPHGCSVKKHPGDSISEQLNDYTYVLGYEDVYQSLQCFIEKLQGFNYRPLMELRRANKTWQIKLSRHYEWFSRQVASAHLRQSKLS